MWWDPRGFLWLFGGSGYGASGSDNYLNDLWRFDLATGQWTWVKGSNATGRSGTYGSKGIPGAANTPGARSHAAVWTDEHGRLWLFGGFGYNFVGQQEVARTGESDAAGRIPEVFGVPSSPGGGARPVAIVGFRPGTGGITRQGDQTVYDFESEQVVAQEGAAAPGANGGKFLSFLDVVAGRGPEGQRVTALLGSLSGVTKAGDTGILVSQEGAEEPLELVAREGTEPPGAPGAVFKSFQSLSVQEGRGVLFKAKLASGTSAAKRSNDEGLWATDTTGELRLLLRKGEVIGGKTLQAFTILHAVARTQGQRRAWNSGDAAATLIYLASFTDGSNAVLTTSVP